MRIPYRKREYRGGHQVELLQSGEQFFTAVEKVIDEARRFIHFQVYILDEDETGIRVVNALIRAAGRGVRTYLLLDAYGTGYLSGEFISRIENAGIIFRFFSPTFITKRFHFNQRLHSKVVLADGEVAITGGMNFADRYRGTPENREWLDFALLFRGPECSTMLNILRRLWNKTFISREERSFEKVYFPKAYEEDVKLKVLQNNWFRNKIEILRSYRNAFRNAGERMIIFASYFLPGRNERWLLRNAARRGVDISIVFAAKSDAPMFSRATGFLYDFILKNNIRIYEYLPSNLHAKVAVVDGEWSTIGSYNMNHLSDYGSVEINVDILDKKFTGEFERKLLGIIENDCRQVTPEEFLRRQTMFSRIRGWWSYQMIRFMMRLMWVMTPHRKKASPD
jgi:cardiolipin synthase